MQTRGRGAAATAAIAALVGGWFTAQLLLAHRAMGAMHRDELVMYARFLRMHPAVAPTSVTPVHVRDWLLPAVESVIGLVACALAVATLVAGGRRRSAMLPALLPLSLL